MHTKALLRRNTAWNIAGQAVPIVAAIFAIPALLARLGQDRFGVLTLIWVIVGYSGLFDLGVGRALTALVAGSLAANNSKEIPALVWTSLALMFILGIAGGGALAATAPWVVHHLGRIPAALHQDMIHAIWVLAGVIPIAICMAGLTGILAAAQRFDLVNLVQAPLGLLSYLGPLCVAIYSPSLTAIAVVLFVSRLAAAGVYLSMCRHALPEMGRKAVVKPSIAPRVLSLGGWMTVTNIVSPLMASLDRFFIAALISAKAVAYYATSQEIVNRTTFIPVALVTALFPSFAGAAASSAQINRELFDRALDYVFLLAFPVALLLAGFAHDGLAVWLGPEFAGAATLALQILAFGMLVNSLARVPFTFVQAVCRPDLSAKAHLIELPFYIAVLIGLTKLLGLYGVALAWTLRVVVDAAVLSYCSLRLAPNLGPSIRRISWHTLLACPAFAALIFSSSRIVHYGSLAVMLAIFAYIGWTTLLTADERQSIRRLADIWRRNMALHPATPDLET